MTFMLAHLSDVHLGPLPRLGIRHWNVKRGLGFLNWHGKRKSAHLGEVLDLLVADVLAQRPDHIAVTGDLINIGLPVEFVAAEVWLRRLGEPEWVTVVPGNHDIYTTLRGDPGVERWKAYMVATAAGAGPLSFPFVRRFGHVALIGVNTAIPTPPLKAGGWLGAAQLARLAANLDQLAVEGATRVVLLHHPPLAGQAIEAKALEDAAALEAMLIGHGAELVLHGHNHRSMYAERQGPKGSVPVVGVPSASMGRRHKGEELARYHLFRIAADGTIEMVSRGLAEPDGRVVEIERRSIAGARARVG